MDKTKQPIHLKPVFTILVSQGNFSWNIPVFHNLDGSYLDYSAYFCKFGDICSFVGNSSNLIPYHIYDTDTGRANMSSVSDLYVHRNIHLMGDVVKSLEVAISKFTRESISSPTPLSEVPDVIASDPGSELIREPASEPVSEQTASPTSDPASKSTTMLTPEPAPTPITESDYDSALAEIETLHGHTRNRSPTTYDLNDYSGKSGLYILLIHKTDDSPRFYKYGFCSDLATEILDIMTEFRSKKYRIGIMSIVVADDKSSYKIMDKLDIWFKQFNCGSAHPTLGRISTSDWTWRMNQYAKDILAESD